MAENSNYENSLIGLAKNYGNYFEDSNSPFGAESWNQLIDPETYELIFVKEKKDKELISRLGNWHGKKCYEYMECFDSPCNDCHLRHAGKDNFFVCMKINQQTGNKYFTESILLEHNGKPAVLEKVIDVSDPEYREIVVNEYMSVRNLSNDVLSTLMEESQLTENFERVCELIGTFFDADRALITEYCLGKLNTTWSSLDKPFTQVCTELSDESIRKLTEATANLNFIWVPDVANADRLEPNLRNYWSSCEIKSILLVPMYFNGSFIGTVSLHNIRKHFNAIDTLKLIGLTVAKCIHSFVTETRAQRQLFAEPLTGALNMMGLKRISYDLFREYPDNQYYFGVIDIRYFGAINRRYGFELGDRILIKTADVFTNSLDKDEAFCRISADEFCFIAKFPGKEIAQKRFEKFVETMQCFEKLTAAGYSIDFRCGAYILEDDKNIAQAIDKANLARLSLKNESGSRIAFFSDELLEKSKREAELLQDFKPALAHGELSVYFQPQCNYSSNKVVGAEALVRWKSPKHGNVSPADFIPLLEQHGLIFELDKFVWEEVCRYQQKWITMGYECPISVNVSRHDVLQNNICDELCSLLDKYQIPKRLLPLEITETAYIKNSEELINVVDTLKVADFTVEMDDFGSGYSSLNVLKDVSVDLLKLDMKFLDMRDKKGKGGSILNCVVRMARWLSLGVLAEGVETKEQADYLKNIGCDLMQGYYFAHPMPANEFEQVLTAQDNILPEVKTAPITSPDKFMESLMDSPHLFNNIGPAAILEHCDQNVEVIMVNDSFLEVIGLSRKEFLPHMNNILDFAQSSLVNPEFLNNIKDTPRTMQIWDSVLKKKDGSTHDIQIFCRTILRTDDRSLLLVCLNED